MYCEQIEVLMVLKKPNSCLILTVIQRLIFTVSSIPLVQVANPKLVVVAWFILSVFITLLL